jgi:hypothetical protein
MASVARTVQGQIVSFDKATGHNTVNVMGGVITDAQIAVNGADIGYVAGDPVIMEIIGNTYTILCKVTPAGGSNYASAAQASVGYFAGTAAAQPYTSASGVVTIASAAIVVPPWSNRITFMGSAELSFANNTGTDADASAYHVMNNNPSGGMPGWSSGANHNQTFAKYQSGVQSVVPGSTVFAQAQFSCAVNGTIQQGQCSGVVFFTKA